MYVYVYVCAYVYMYVKHSLFIHLADVFSQSSYFGCHLSYITAVLLLCTAVSWGCEPDPDLGTRTSALPITEDLSEAQAELGHCHGTALLTWLRSGHQVWSGSGGHCSSTMLCCTFLTEQPSLVLSSVV